MTSRISPKNFSCSTTRPEVEQLFLLEKWMGLEKLTTVGLSNFRGPKNAYFAGAFSDFFHGIPLGPLGCQQSSTTTEVCCSREAGIPGRWSWEMRDRFSSILVDEGDGFLTRDAPKINKNGGVIPWNAIWKWPDRKEWGGWWGTLR